MSTLFRLSRVSYSYLSEHALKPAGSSSETKKALSGIDLTIKKGERLAVAGENGAGKTTLLRLLAGADRPDSGTLLYCGDSTVPRGFLLQDPDDQLFCSSVYEDLAFGPYCLGIEGRKLEQRIRRVCRLLEIEELVEKPPWALSFGQKKICALASILTLEPEVLLLDEPTAGLDTAAVERVVRAIESFSGTVVMISHDLDVLERLCQRIIILKNGRIKAELSAKEHQRLELCSRTLGADHSLRADILKEASTRFGLRHSESSPAQGNLLEVKGLSCGYGPTPVLEEVSFSVSAGERLALVGENGAGKTTLLKALQGALPGARGIVKINGAELSELKGGWNRIGMVFQESSLQLFCPSVRQEVAFGPEQLGLPADEVEERVRFAMDAMGLNGYEDRVPQNLSGGEKKRVALASVISMRPDLYILDEPSTGLDHETEAIMASFFKNTEAAFILVTHHLHLVEELAQRVLILHGGRLRADLPAETFLEFVRSRIQNRSQGAGAGA